MMKQPTVIYWLLDVRPETIAVGWHSGYPFYCGKTIRPSLRLYEHVQHAKANPDKKKSQRVLACGDHLRLQIVETVPPGGRWRERERHWIKALRAAFPDNLNTTDGGEGHTTAAQRARHKEGIRNSKRCREAATRKRLAAVANRAHTPANMRARIRAHRKYLLSLESTNS